MLISNSAAWAFDYSKFTYTWTDENGEAHTNNVTEKATNPNQMIALRNYVMSNPEIPGNLNVDGVEGGEVNYTYAPNQDGFTCFLVELKDGTGLGTVSDDNFKKSVKSMQLLTNVAECENAYIVSFTGKYDRFYFAAKGKARVINSAKDGWEQLSATGNNTGIEGTPEFYTDLLAGEIYKVSHDCQDVASLRHFYSVNPGTGNEPYLQNVTMVVPKDRMTFWVADATHPAWPNSTGNSRDNAGKYTWYNPSKCPLIGIYQAKLVGSAKQASNYSETNRQFTINLAWDSNLRSTKTEGDEALLNVGALNWQGGETYDIYLINDDGTETLLATVNDTKDYTYNVPQHEQGYQLHYKVTCRPAESDANNPVGPAVTNYITLAIPGYVDEFIWTYAYRSHFDVASHQNSYKNTIRLSPYQYDRTTVPERVVYRKKADGNGVTTIATLHVNGENQTYTLTYENPMAMDAALRFDQEPLTLSGNIDDEIIIHDYFLASTANGGDQAGSYYYYIEVVKDASGKSHVEQVEIPVYCSTISSSYPHVYTVQEMQADTNRGLALSDVAKVEMSKPNEKKYDAVSSWDIYKGNNLQYLGSISANADIVTNDVTYYTGQITINSQFGANTYGTNPTMVQGGYVECTADSHYGIYTQKGEPTGEYAYAGNVKIQPFTASEIAPYVVYYRVWRAPKNEATEVLLNDLEDQKGKEWSTSYHNVKSYYPIGSATASTAITIVDDIYLAEAFSEGGSKEVTYIVRMYSTPTKPGSDNDIEALSADEAQKVYVSEATVDVIYNGGPTVVTEVEAEVVNVTYFDMFGRSGATPFKGVNIKMETRANGSITTTKIIR